MFIKLKLFNIFGKKKNYSKKKYHSKKKKNFAKIGLELKGVHFNSLSRRRSHSRRSSHFRRRSHSRRSSHFRRRSHSRRSHKSPNVNDPHYFMYQAKKHHKEIVDQQHKKMLNMMK
jgi:hypothetical protein